jgi:hypothetical protein
MNTFKFTIICPGFFLNGTTVSRRSTSRTLAELYIRGVISRGKGIPSNFKLTPQP